MGAWIALYILVHAVSAALAVNHRSSRIRSVGMILIAFGCIEFVAWFLFLVNAGIISQPRAPVLVVDTIKPAILWVITIIATICGLATLLTVSKNAENLSEFALPLRNSAVQYGYVSRTIHWVSAYLFIVLMPIGIVTSMVPEAAENRAEYYVVHKTLGVVIIGLVLIRLIWNWLSHRPIAEDVATKLEAAIRTMTHILLYFFLIALPFTGYIMTSYDGYPTYVFFLEFWPLWDENQVAAHDWGVFHKYFLHYLFYAVLAFHLIGAFKHKLFRQSSNAIVRMLK